MKKNFLKFLLLGVFTLSLGAGFVGCKDYDDDIDDLWKAIDAQSTTIDELKNQLGGKSVKDISANGNVLTVTYTDNTTAQVTVGSSTSGSGVMTIGTDGYWYNDGVQTLYKAIGGSPTISSDGYWRFPTGKVVDGALEYETSTILATGAYVVEHDNYYELWVAAKGSTTLQAIRLPKGASASDMAELDVMGWLTVTAADMTINVNAASFHKGGAIADDFPLNYAWVEKFVKVWDSNKDYGNSWSARYDVVKKQMLLGTSNNMILVRVSPATLDPSYIDFTLQDSEGNTLPLSFGTPIAYSGTLTTRAESSSSLYLLPIIATDETFESTGAFTSLFNPGNAYTLTADASFRSPFMGFSVATPAAAASAQPTPATHIYVNDDLYVANMNILVGEDNSLSFDGSRNIYDYYVEAKDKDQAALFGFSADKKAGTFKVTQLPDQLTDATITLYVFALGIDGKVYRSEITLTPRRTMNNDVTIALGNLQIMGTNDAAKKVVSLTPMFDALGTANTTIWQSATLGGPDAVTATLTRSGDVSATNLLLSTEAQSAINLRYLKNATDAISTGAYPTSRNIEFTPQFAKAGAAALVPGELYTFTIKFTRAGALLNTLKITFTPVVPSLTDYMSPKDGMWVDDVLMAYYANPLSAADGTAPVNQGTAKRYAIALGFNKLGSTENEDLTAITLNIDANQKIDGTTVKGTLAEIGTKICYPTTSTQANIMEIKVVTNEQPAYNQELNIIVESAKYLTYYDFSDAEIDAAAFKMKVMSAMEQGKITPADGVSVKAVASGVAVAKLTEADFKAVTYNPAQTYKLFPVVAKAAGSTVDWEWSYIKSVEFQSGDTSYYNVVNAAGDAVTTATPVAPTWDTDTYNESYVGIKGGMVSGTVNTTIKVIVTDWFGQVKEFTVPLQVTFN